MLSTHRPSAIVHYRTPAAAIGSGNCNPAARLGIAVGRRKLQIVAFKEDDKEVADRGNVTFKPKEALDKLFHGRWPGSHKEHNQSTADAQGLVDPTTANSSHSSKHKRVPMSFAHKEFPPAFEAPLNTPVFSRRREVLVGRVAMAGFYASCMWESFLMGLGPISQLSVITGLPKLVLQGVLLGFMLHGLWGLLPFTPTWSKANRKDLALRPKGFPRALINPVNNPEEFFGYSRWGFTKRNEVFAGRIAMLGFVGTCMAEAASGGRGALGQVAWWLHLPISPTYYQLCNVLLIGTPVVFGVLAYVKGRPGELKGGDDIY